MATFSNGPRISLPDFSSGNRYVSSAGDMRFRLQALLDNKEKQLQHARMLSQRVLAQQMELEEMIRQLQEPDVEGEDDNEVDAEATERYRELVETMRTWDAENELLSNEIVSKVI